MTQQELASAVGLSRTAITNLESGKQGTTIEVLIRVAHALGQPPEILLPTRKAALGDVVGDENDTITVQKYIDSSDDEAR